MLMFLVMDEMKIYCTTYYYDKRNCDRRKRGKGLVKNIIVKQINFKDILFNRFIMKSILQLIPRINIFYNNT